MTADTVHPPRPCLPQGCRGERGWLPERFHVNRTAGHPQLRDVYLAFVRIHLLHHAAEEQLFRTAMMAELKRPGYAIGPGTLYPLLQALETEGVLTSTQESRRNWRRH
jgi:DNA-binding PadR family transcriptional regulator